MPHSVVVKDSSPMILARPKSASLIERSLSARRMFSGLMSLCTMLRSCCAHHVRVLVNDANGQTYQIFDALE